MHRTCQYFAFPAKQSIDEVSISLALEDKHLLDSYSVDLHKYITRAIKGGQQFTAEDLMRQWQSRDSPDDCNDEAVSPPKRKRVEGPRKNKVKKSNKDAPAEISRKSKGGKAVQKKSMDVSSSLAAQEIVAFNTQYNNVFPVITSQRFPRQEAETIPQRQQQSLQPTKKQQPMKSRRPQPQKQPEGRPIQQNAKSQAPQRSPRSSGMAATDTDDRLYERLEALAAQGSPLLPQQQEAELIRRQRHQQDLQPKKQQPQKSRPQPKQPEGRPHQQHAKSQAPQRSPCSSGMAPASDTVDDWLYERDLGDLASTGRVFRSAMATLEEIGDEPLEDPLFQSSYLEDSAIFSDDSDGGSNETSELERLRQKISKLEEENKRLKHKLDACQFAGR